MVVEASSVDETVKEVVMSGEGSSEDETDEDEDDKLRVVLPPVLVVWLVLELELWLELDSNAEVPVAVEAAKPVKWEPYVELKLIFSEDHEIDGDELDRTEELTPALELDIKASLIEPVDWAADWPMDDDIWLSGVVDPTASAELYSEVVDITLSLLLE